MAIFIIIQIMMNRTNIRNKSILGSFFAKPGLDAHSVFAYVSHRHTFDHVRAILFKGNNMINK